MSKPAPRSTFEDQLNKFRAHGIAPATGRSLKIDIHKYLHSLGFQVCLLEAGRWRVEKKQCAAVLEANSEGALLLQSPGYLIGDEIGHLVDGGYQKFLSTPSRKLPATAEHLREIHAFEEELRAALGLTSLYNEALGTVSERYHYDRVKGRE